MAAKVVSVNWVPLDEAPVTVTMPAPRAPRILPPDEHEDLWRLYFHEADTNGLGSHEACCEYADLMTS